MEKNISENTEVVEFNKEKEKFFTIGKKLMNKINNVFAVQHN